MSMVGQYIVVGTFASEKDDIILGYFDTLDEANEFDSNLYNDIPYGDYCDLEFTHIYKLEGVENEKIYRNCSREKTFLG